MDNNSKNTQASEQQENQQAQGGADQGSGTQPPEKLFTQADVDRRELEQYKNEAFLKEKGVSEQYRGYVSFEAAKLVDDKTNFQQAVEKFLGSNPAYAGRGFKVVSTGIRDGGNGSGGAAGEAEIRKAMGLKG